MTFIPSRFMTITAWKLKPGHTGQEARSLLERDIEPHYLKLPGLVRLELIYVDATDTYFAIQRWTARQAHENALAAPEYQAWWDDYQPTLARWNEIMDYDGEVDVRYDT